MTDARIVYLYDIDGVMIGNAVKEANGQFCQMVLFDTFLIEEIIEQYEWSVVDTN